MSLQLSEVKRDLMMGNEKAFEEQRIRNKFLRDKVTALEQQVAAQQQQIEAGEVSDVYILNVYHFVCH